MSASVLKRRDVEGEHGDDEHEQEDGDRRADAEVVDAAERRAPHRERDHVGARSATSPGASVITRSKTFRTLMIIVMKTTDQHRREQRHGDAPEDLPFGAPSVRAASSTSRGIAARPAPITTIAKPAQIQMYAISSDGRDQLRAEPGEAAPRLAERLRADRRRWYVPGATSVKSNVAVGRSSMVCDRLAARRGAARSRPAARAPAARPCRARRRRA